ncbi:hypothetical protein DFH07DRAFT_817531 [Mycena maculata]|uniref:Uncharacterized protein n=1 Tax=Mycena maculata TaxID=230809 RepID=A0AAD7J8H3_9AGAR|nr:hypothetical protein DFH07DRAFT_817531 [Mycena maculata]
MVELVQDLIDRIVDETSTKDSDFGFSSSDRWWRDKDQASLRPCALVSRAFLAPSQRCLFRSLSLNGWKQGRDKAVVRGFSENHHLASYVRDLDFELYPDARRDKSGHVMATIFPLVWRYLPMGLRGRPHLSLRISPTRSDRSFIIPPYNALLSFTPNFLPH